MSTGEKNIRHRFVISGPESTGKSSLCQELADHFNGSIIPEYARSYLEEHGPEYDESDLAKIAQGQQKLIEESQASIAFCDTDLLTVIIWLATRFGKENKRMLDQWIAFEPELYLLCKPDVAWVYDPLRECEHIRDDLFELHLDLLKEYNKNYVVIEGNFTERFKKAAFEVNRCLKK